MRLVQWVRSSILVFVIAGATVSMAVEGPATSELKFTFVGNEAWVITDGEMTLASDFPYQSGAFGYMKYKSDDVETVGEVVSLITHRHADHFAVKEYREASYTLIGPASVTALVPGHDTFTIEAKLSYKGIDIEAYLTPHTEQHRSYLVTWHGVRIYFTGDTDDAGKLLTMKDIDVAFVTPWLLGVVAESGTTIDAGRVIVYHHRIGEEVTAHQDRVVPKQGNTFTIPFVAASE
jgi:hypothetical protein